MTRQVENQNVVNRRIIFGLYHQDRLLLQIFRINRYVIESITLILITATSIQSKMQESPSYK